MLDNHRGEDLESPGLFCPGAFPRMVIEGHPHSPLGFPMGNKRNVGSHGNRICTFATKLCRVLVGRVDIGRAGVQRPWHLGGTEDLPNPRDARVQVGVDTRHREHHWKIEESCSSIHTCQLDFGQVARSNVHAHEIRSALPASHFLASLGAQYILPEARLRDATLPSVCRWQIALDWHYRRTFRQVNFPTTWQ